jgi:putative N6-adenine-specific DNA methylase
VNLFASTLPGLEDVLGREVAAFATPTVVPGGVAFSGDVLETALLRLSTASRVLVRVGEIRARDFATLVREAKKLPWRDYLFALTPKLAITCTKCRLFHTGAIAERLLAVMGAPTDAPEVRVVVRGVNDVFEISVDAGGEPMHVRGGREQQGKAPLRETVAAGILALAKWDPETPLVDPVCGAGTLPLEAARIAARRAPGAQRQFAAERFTMWNDERWRSQRDAAAKEERPLPAPIFGRDVDPRAIAKAKANDTRGEVRWDTIAVERSALPEGPPGLVVANPPWGERLPAGRGIDASLRRLLRPGWRLAVLTTGRPSGAFAETHALVNGGLRVKLFVT